jgi:hypothetical protein
MELCKSDISHLSELTPHHFQYSVSYNESGGGSIRTDKRRN